MHSWKAEGQMMLPPKLLGATLQTLPAWLGSLQSSHGLHGERLMVLHRVWTWYNTHQTAAGSDSRKHSPLCTYTR